MTPEKTQILLKKFPTLYRGYTEPLTQSLMGFYFECDDGWFQLIYNLSEKLEGHVKAVQVKEKFGGLRFYVDGYSEEIGNLIADAERLSCKTCEVCGQPGSSKGGGWIKTLCQPCLESPKYESYRH